ncbi:hypothetical protein SBRCBS47491_007512 [Sporothrix bragantina]|uniref:Uncharacterized protein n=1 Tax=Sporothrix bragantina TaxID=671064 RepID=A0ABP0CDS2_9PEZI
MTIYASTFAPAVVPRNESFWQCILRLNVDDTPDDKVILQEHERPHKQFTYASAPHLAGLGADGLREVLSLKRGDTVLIVGSNTLDYLHIELAALWMGVTAALGNESATTSDLVHMINTVQPVAVFCDAALMESMGKALQESTTDTTKPKPPLVGIGERGTAGLAFPDDFIRDTTDKAKPSPPLDLSKEDSHTVPALICFSSGTTSGMAKAAVLSHYNVLAYPLLYRASEPSTATSRERDVFYRPLSHIYGVFVTATALYTGGYVRLLRSYTLPTYLAACVASRATTLRMVAPTVVDVVKLLQDPSSVSMDLSSVKTIVCAGAMLPPEMITAVQTLLGNDVAIVQAYGMTEGLATVVSRAAGARKPGSVGRPLSGGQLRIVDDSMDDVQPGQEGEIIFTSPTVFMGYRDEKFDGGDAFVQKNGQAWLRSGDVGRMDSDGFLWLTDRKKDMIKYNSNQVSPAELEGLLLSHPLVLEAGVCATWDAVQQTEVPIGYVRLTESVADIDNTREKEKVLAEIRAFVDGQVASHKKLRGGLVHLPTMPRNATGKLLRRNLPARLEAKRTSSL